MYKTTLSICFLFLFFSSIAQSPHLSRGTQGYDINDRWDVLHWKDYDHYQTSLGDLHRSLLMERLSTRLSSNTLSKIDQADINYLQADNNEEKYEDFFSPTTNPNTKKVYEKDNVFYTLEEVTEEQKTIERREGLNLFNTFYKTPAHFFEVNTDGFTLRVNPMLNVSYGMEKDSDNIIFQNVRGVDIRGTIQNNVYFYTNIIESQARFNNFLERRINKYKTIPGNGFYKTYNSSVIDDLKGWDFLNSQAYVGVNVNKSIAIELGHGKHFIGNGIRSLFLSDYAHNYFYLKFNTKIWKFNYQNLFAELAPISHVLNSGDKLLPKKYMASHFLSFAPWKNVEFGIYETVVFSRENHFELQYLNPIILYRSVEQFLDSPDNVLIGLSGKWNVTPGVQLYGQMILDEFKIDELTSDKGWWANKYGFQTGVKYYDVAGIDHLDIQAEYNIVRPYTYAHRDTLDGFTNQNVASFTHYNQPLAHPLGSNFKELLLEVRYRPLENLFIKGRAVKALYGQDPTGKNYGGNPLLPLETRVADYGNTIGQGVETDIMLMSLDVSYQFYHNYFIDLRVLHRTEDAEGDTYDVTTDYFSIGLRANLGLMHRDY